MENALNGRSGKCFRREKIFERDPIVKKIVHGEKENTEKKGQINFILPLL